MSGARKTHLIGAWKESAPPFVWMEGQLQPVKLEASGSGPSSPSGPLITHAPDLRRALHRPADRILRRERER